MKKSLLALAVLGAFMAGCSDHSSDVAHAPQYTAPAAPQTAAPQQVVVQQPAQSGTGDLLTGAALGYMAGNLLNGGGSRQQAAPETRIIERRTVVNNYIERRPTVKETTPAPTASPSKPNYGATYQAAKPAAPSYGATYAAAKSSSLPSSYGASRPSSFSSPSRSSFSSGRR